MDIQARDIRKIIVACDAGMGSSVMLAGQLRRQLSKHDVTVTHTPVNSIPADADLVVCHAGLAQRARAGAGDKPIVTVQVFIGDPAITGLVAAIKSDGVLHV